MQVHGTKLDHAAHNKPDAVLEQRDNTAPRHMNKVAFLVIGFQQFPKTGTSWGELTGGIATIEVFRGYIRSVWSATCVPGKGQDVIRLRPV